MKYTVITEASSKIGKEIAVYFTSKRHNITAAVRRKELLNNLKKLKINIK